jgi:carbonic anhydrase
MDDRNIGLVASRRGALSVLGGALLCPLCQPAFASGSAASGHTAPHWSYEGEAGPESWGGLAPEMRVCSMGMEQTPIDLAGATRATLGAVEVRFQPLQPKVLNNGHTIQVIAEGGGFSLIEGDRYDLLQVHFHHPSEHLLAGRAFDLECHFVHKSAAGALAVLGVFIRPGQANPVLEPIWAAMPAEGGKDAALATTIDLTGLLPAERGFFRYMGSLTTPPCSEGLTWTVFKAPVEASVAQIQQFAALFPMNARPVQSRHRRFLLETA